MPTPNEITTIIAAKFKRELDIPYRLMLYEEVKAWRARLLANTLDRNPQDKVAFMQHLVVPMDTMDNQSVTTVKVPRAIERGPMLYDYVGTVDGSQAFTFAPTGTARYLKAGCYGSLIPTWDRIDCRIWVDRPGMCDILVKGVFDDPDAAYNCCGTDPWDSPFPVSEKLLQQIIEYVTQQQLQAKQQDTQTADVAVPTDERSVQRS